MKRRRKPDDPTLYYRTAAESEVDVALAPLRMKLRVELTPSERKRLREGVAYHIREARRGLRAVDSPRFERFRLSDADKALTRARGIVQAALAWSKLPKRESTRLRDQALEDLVRIFVEESPEGSEREWFEYVRSKLQSVGEFVPETGDQPTSYTSFGKTVARLFKRARLN